MVVISAGFHKTHVTTAAREALNRDSLAVLITGAYPTSRVRRWAKRLNVAERGRLGRLLERGEGIPDARLRVGADDVLHQRPRRPFHPVPFVRSVHCGHFYRTNFENARRFASSRIFESSHQIGRRPPSTVSQTTSLKSSIDPGPLRPQPLSRTPP